MKPRFIVIDGKMYYSVDEMPEDVRKRYEQALLTLKDQDGNRIPDVLEANKILGDNNRNGIPDLMENSAGAPIIVNSIKVLVDGQQFISLDDLPPEVRAKYDQAVGTLDGNRNGIPDFMEGMMSPQQGSAPASASVRYGAAFHARRKPLPTSNVATPDTSNGWMLTCSPPFCYSFA